MSDYGLFYRTWKDKIMSYLVRMSEDYNLSGDIMQETFARHLKHYGPSNRDIPLLYRIARNCFMDEKRHHKNTRAIENGNGDEPSIDEDHHVMIRSEYRRVLVAMEALEKDEREILALVVGGDLSYKEIGAITGISEANVKVKVHRARSKLRKTLKDGET